MDICKWEFLDDAEGENICCGGEGRKEGCFRCVVCNGIFLLQLRCGTTSKEKEMAFVQYMPVILPSDMAEENLGCICVR